jgi:hypothetical protein
MDYKSVPFLTKHWPFIDPVKSNITQNCFTSGATIVFIIQKKKNSYMANVLQSDQNYATSSIAVFHLFLGTLYLTYFTYNFSIFLVLYCNTTPHICIANIKM